MNVIGLNAFHGDSSACLFVNGQMVAAVEEERFRRIKHWAGFPSKSIEYCLASRGLSLADIDIIAINTDPAAAKFKKLAYVLSGKAPLSLVKEKLLVRKQRASITDYLEREFNGQTFTGKIEYVEHHLAHLSSAFHVSGFDKASVISIDGFGDFASVAVALGEQTQLTIDQRVYFPHSMGIFYQALTQYLGFDHYGDEYKVMGLAPYGHASYKDQMDQIVKTKSDGSFSLNLDFFQHHNTSLKHEWDGGSPKIGRLYSQKLTKLLGPARDKNEPLKQRHKDIARSIQDCYERTFFHTLNAMHKQHQTNNLTIAGGCGMNSVANGKIHLHTPYENIYIQSAAGDAGGAIGAAVIAGQRNGVTPDFIMSHSYWGPSYNNTVLKSLIEKHSVELSELNCISRFDLDEVSLFDQVSDYIIDGKVIGWFQGAMEWGPRALGNRSILGDPRRDDMKDILNLKIKRRESFRPFAPSVLKEHVKDWFESDASVPFMMKVFQIREAQRQKIPAVTHADGSGRLQTVTKDSNERYYQLIQRFYEKTGVPMLLNTSFNENEPVVCKPEEALACFLRTQMDVLVLGSHIVVRDKKVFAT